MDVSIFLAKVLGLYLIITSISVLVNHDLYKKVLTEIIKSPALMMLNGVLALIIGILLVISHNVWMPSWQIWITLLAWLSLLKGIIIIGFPQWMISFTKKVLDCKYTYKITLLIYLLIGIYLCYWGFEFNPLTGMPE